ncbi:Uncharacterised protein [Vibrio cholerae]|nr:Uncharacterised protein [Vibrio cholerae]CSC97366.1 Uncharacterised protein [Vibrio cholerae]
MADFTSVLVLNFINRMSTPAYNEIGCRSGNQCSGIAQNTKHEVSYVRRVSQVKALAIG